MDPATGEHARIGTTVGLSNLRPMADVSMPRLSDSMEEGTILKWLKSDGDEVKRGDELVEIETDKANMTYEADQDGVLSISASEGDTLAVGEKIASIGEGCRGASRRRAEPEPEAEQQDEQPEAEQQDEERRPEEEHEQEQPSEEPAPEPVAEPEPEPPRREPEADEDEGTENGRIRASPVARRMARELGLELEALEGTGPGGRIVKADVEAAAGGSEQEPATATAEAPAPRPRRRRPRRRSRSRRRPPPRTPRPAAATSEVQELTRLQQTVARRMAESKATAPDFVLNVEVDMEEAVELRKQLKAAAGERTAPSFNDFVVKAARSR